MAKSYSLKLTHIRGFSSSFSGELVENFEAYDERLASGLYYLSFQISSGEGHAIGWDKSNSEFCDANFGIYKFGEMKNAGELVAEVSAWMLNATGKACTALQIYEAKK